MKGLKATVLAGGVLALLASSAAGADLPTEKAPPKANRCASFASWLDSTPADCPLSFGPLTVYGAIDVGAGYETNAAPFNAYYPNGVEEIIGKQGNGARWLWVPNGQARSNLGLKLKQRLTGDVDLIGDVDFGFDPYSLQFANGPQSLASNNAIPAYFQTSNGDSSRAGSLWNSRAYIGLSSPNFGALTIGRQYALSNTTALAYDPMSGGYAFGLLGYSSASVSGLGVSETARYNTSIQYMYDYQKVLHVGALAQVGGYEQGNGANQAYQVNVGANWAGLSLDAIYSYARDAVSLSAYGGNGGQFGLPKGVEPNDLKATLADVSAFLLAARYQWRELTLYGGYAHENFANPSDSYAWGIGATMGGYAALPGAVTSSAYTINRVQQVVWTGAKYAILPNLDVAAAYYRLWQNNYSGAVCTANTAKISGSAVVGQGSNSSKCDGVEPVGSVLIAYRPWKRVETYAGLAWSQVTGGLATGYIQNSNTAFTAGVTFSF